jgi:hypothetical protein
MGSLYKLILVLFMSFTEAFRPYMMSSNSETYLQSLNIKHASQLKPVIASVSQATKETNQTYVNIDTLLLNMNRVENVFLNRNSKTIMLKLRDEMKHICYVDEADGLMKLSNNTKMLSQAFKNFFIYPMEINVDAIIYKE